MDQLAAAAAGPAMAMDVDPEDGVALAFDAAVQEIHESLDVSDGVVPSQVVDDPSEREGNGLG